MYSVEYLPLADNDIDEIFNYILNVLKNKAAAHKLKIELIKIIEKITIFPYGSPIYNGNLKYEYRREMVKNFLIFYVVDEKNRKIIISRILYKKMNYLAILK